MRWQSRRNCNWKRPVRLHDALGDWRGWETSPAKNTGIGEVGNADCMNQRRVRVLPRSESRRGEYTAKPRQRKTLGLARLQTSSAKEY